MKRFNSLFSWRKMSLVNQLMVVFTLIGIPSALCFLFRDYLGYQVVAFLLLFVVSFLAVTFDRIPVFFGAILSALIWNFFFIKPYFTLTIEKHEDVFLLLMYFVISMLNVFITSKIKKAEKIEVEKHQQEKSIALYNTILQALSHELRTPITTILGSVDTLIEQKDLPQILQVELLKNVEIASLRLNDQVDKLLNQSRIDALNIHPVFDWITFEELFFPIINEKTNGFDKRNFNISPLDFSQFPLVKTDNGLLSVILYNLIQNADRYSPKEAPIEIKVEVGEKLSISIGDFGSGIVPEKQDEMLLKFVRGNTTVSGGLGLGLSIVNGLVKVLDGTLQFSNNEPHGLIATIELPIETTFLNAFQHE